MENSNKEMHNSIGDCLDELIHVAANEPESNNYDVCTAAGEIEINGKMRQIQIQLISNHKLWCREDEVRIQEIVKIHNDQ